MPLKIINNLPPSFVRPYLDSDSFFKRFQADKFETDPSPSPESLGLGFSQPGGWKKPDNVGDFFEWTFDRGSNTFSVIPYGIRGNRIIKDHPVVQRAEIDVERLKALPSVVAMPTVATLGVWDPALQLDQPIGKEHVREVANKRVIENALSGGWLHAKNLSLPQELELFGFYRIAAMMDTWGRSPQLMTKGLINDQIDWHLENFSDLPMLIGTGSENLEGHLTSEQRAPGGLREGTIQATYIKARKEQLQKVLEAGHTPILFPDVMHKGLSDAENIEIVNQLLKFQVRSIVAHVLGTPFVPDTDWYNLAVLKKTAPNALAVKTSTPNHQAQLDYHRTVTDARSIMLTGDDRGWAVELLYGAQKLLESKTMPDLEQAERNGFKYIKGPNNIGGLLGYFGLNLHQTIAAINELNQWFHNSVFNTGEETESHLKKYLELTVPAMGMSTDVFFGSMNPTKAYTWYVWLSNIFTGVLNEEDGAVLPHKSNVWKNNLEEQIIGGRLLTWMILCGAVTIGEAEQIVQKHDKYVLGGTEIN